MATPRKENPQKGGRPPIYNKGYHPKKVRYLIEFGMTEPEVAAFFEVTLSCIDKWKADHPEFLREIEKGRELPVKMSRKLYKRAEGYAYKEIKEEIAPARDTEVVEVDPNDPKKNIVKIIRVPEMVVCRVETTKQVPPDVTALKFVLTNRAKKHWQDATHIDHTSKGAALGSEMDLSKLTDEEVAILAALEAKAKGEDAE